MVLAVVMLAATSVWAQGQQRIAAIVNDDVISMYDLATRIRMVIAMSRLQDTSEVRRRLAPQILRALVDEKLQVQEAKRLNINVSTDDITRAITVIEAQNGLQPGGLTGFLDRNNISLATLFEQVRANLSWARVIRRRIRPLVQVGADEIDEALSRLKARVGLVRYRVSEIFLAVDSPEDEGTAAQNATRLVEQIRGGANFAILARQFSQSPTAAVGGDIGEVYSGQLDERLEIELQRLGAGEISAPIRTEAGFYILRLHDKRSAGDAQTSPGDTRLSLHQIFLPLQKNASRATRASQLDLARVASETVADCNDMKRLAVELRASDNVDLGTVQAKELSPQIRQVVMQLPLYQASQPIVQDIGIAVLMVCARTAPQQTAETLDRDAITSTLGRQRVDMMARRYLRDLRRAAFLDLRA
jgi:peptidyl-prolyl cis-trans isomerase SurA